VVRRAALVRMVAIGIVTAILVTLVAVLIPWLPDSASEQMDRITFTYWFTTVICIAIFALVAAVSVYSIFAFRAQPEDDGDGPPIHGHTGLEIAWTAVPALLVIAIGVVTAVVLSQNANASANALDVRVFAQQFAWRFEYPDQKGLRSYELVLPVDRDVEFTMTAADVIHSFWIPEMGQKQDVVPGVETTIVVTPTRTGSFTLVCTELCGLGHATMRAPVRVLSQADWSAWVKEQQAAAAPGPGGTDGAAVFASAGCGGCHAFAPAGTDGAIGPGLDDLAAAAEKAGQPLDEFVRASIVDPDAMIGPGFEPGVMPKTFGQSLTEDEIDALVTYLTETK
jgi:cytochrome c oxidase subunit 2